MFIRLAPLIGFPKNNPLYAPFAELLEKSDQKAEAAYLANEVRRIENAALHEASMAAHDDDMVSRMAATHPTFTERLAEARERRGLPAK